MKNNKKFMRYFIWHILTFIIGIGLFVYPFVIPMGDNVLTTMGIALMIIMGFRIYGDIKNLRNEDEMKKFIKKNTEERTVYIANKSRSLAFALNMYIQFIVGIVLYFTEYKTFSSIIFYVTCAQILLYLVIYMYYNKKY